MLRRLIFGLMKRLPMVCRDRATGYVIRCHIAGIVSTLARGDYLTCDAFETKGLKCFARQRFICLILGSVLPCLPFAAMALPYQPPSYPDEQAGSAEAEQTIVFDIPPQSLLTALRAYSEVTGQAVLVDNTLASGRSSPGVRGAFDKIEALKKLLAGTGLVASYSSDQAFTLKLAEPGETSFTAVQERPEATQVGGIDAVTERYAGKIQRSIEAALCQSDLTRPGTYRLAMQIWIARSGKVERTQLLTSMHNLQRDDEVRDALDRLTLEPPPVDMPQPITLLLLPGRSGYACAGTVPPQG